jgi:O-methyltransferase
VTVEVNPSQTHPVAAAGATPHALYLDLLKRCLTRYTFETDLSPVVPGDSWKRRVWATVERTLGRRDIAVHRRTPFDPALRAEGRDWPASAETMVGLKRLDNLQFCVEQVVADDVPGDLLEAGVWRGGASIFMRGVLASLGVTDRTVWLADSFQGLPKPSAENPADAGDQHWTQPFLAVSQEQVRHNFERYGLLDDNVRFLEGWFSDTLPTAPVEQVAVLRADGDMYSSTMDILRPMYPKVPVGGFVVIDDYGAIAACRTAVDEYRAEHGITEPLEQIDWTGAFWRRER